MTVEKLDSKVIKGSVARKGVQDFGLQSQLGLRIVARPDRCLEGG